LKEIKEVKRATAGFVLSLIAGILIFFNAVFVLFAAAIMGGMVSIMPGFKGFAQELSAIVTSMGLMGLVSSIVVIAGSILIYTPEKETIGGVLVLIFSILSIVIGGGFMFGFILGIVGGVLGIMKK
jgi:hypothetical protein